MAWLQFIKWALNLLILLLELAFDDIMMGDGDTDELKAAVNHRVEQGENCSF